MVISHCQQASWRFHILHVDGKHSSHKPVRGRAGLPESQ